MKQKPDYTVKNGFTRRRKSFTETFAGVLVVVLLIGFFLVLGAWYFGLDDSVEKWGDVTRDTYKGAIYGPQNTQPQTPQRQQPLPTQ